MMYHGVKTPVWMTILIILLVLPVFSLPALLSAIAPGDSGMKTIVWCYPVYVVMSGWLAWQCYPQRREVSWILLVLMVMSHVAMWIMTGLIRI